MPPLDPRLQQQPGAPPPGPPPDMPPGAPPPDGQEPPPDQPPPEPGGQDMPADDLGAGLKQAPPEEQDQADRFVGLAWQMIYDDKMFDQVLKMLEGGAGPGTEGDPVQGLAATTEMIVARVAHAADTGGQQLTPDVLLHAGGDILEELADLSAKAGIKDYTQDKDSLEKAWFMALDMFRERLAAVGEINQQDAGAGLQRLQQADKDGTLERVMKALADSDQSGQAGGPEPQPGQGGPPQPRPKGFAAAAGLGEAARAGAM